MHTPSTLLATSNCAATSARWLPDPLKPGQATYAARLLCCTYELLSFTTPTFSTANVDRVDIDWCLSSREAAVWLINYINILTKHDVYWHWREKLPLWPDEIIPPLDTDFARTYLCENYLRSDYYRNDGPWWLAVPASRPDAEPLLTSDDAPV